MDTLQTGIFDRFYDELGLGAAETLGGLGNCEAKKLHRGPVYLLMKGEAGRRDATLTVARYPNKPGDNYTLPDENGEMPNGWGIDLIAGGANFGGPVQFAVGWAKAQANWVLVGNNAWESYVDCVLCTDYAGTEDPQGRTVRVYLPRSLTRDPNVRTGDVIHFFLSGGRAFCDSEVFDGKIGEIRELGINEDPADYATGLRGWFPADGANGTDDLNGPLVLYGWTGAGDYATVGAAVTAAFAATIATSAVTVDNNTTGISIANHAAAACAVTDSGHVHGITTTEFTVDGVAEDPGEEVSFYAFASTPINTNSNTTGISVNTPVLTHSITDNGHTHTGTITTLTFSAPTTNRPAGVVVLRIQRVT